MKGETELNMKIDALTQWLDALSTGPSINAANTYTIGSCSICASPMYSMQNCPSTPFFLVPDGTSERFQGLPKQSNGLYSETYNPRLRNHPNFSWKQNQLGDQGGAFHHAHN